MSRRVSMVMIPWFGPRDLTLALRSPYGGEGGDEETGRQGDRGLWWRPILTVLSHNLNTPWTDS